MPIEDYTAYAQQHRIGAVRDNSELGGTFPEGVTVDFWGWTHGMRGDPDSWSEQQDQIRRERQLGRVLAGYTHVGLELAETNPPVDPRSIDEQAALFSAWARDPHRSEDPPDGCARAASHFREILRGIEEAGGNSPVFFYVDSYVAQDRAPLNFDTICDMLFRREAWTERAKLELWAANSSFRRNIVVRQVWDRAREFAASGQDVRMAITQGSLHDWESRAVRALGVPAQQHYVGEKPFAVSARLQKRMELGVGDALTEDVIARHFAAATLGETMLRAASWEFHGQDWPYERLNARQRQLYVACLRGMEHRLPEERQVLFDAAEHAITDPDRTYDVPEVATFVANVLHIVAKERSE